MSQREIERRNTARPVEFRAGDGGGPGVLTGYAAVFNSLSQNLGGFVERVDPAAFNKSLADDVAVVARFNHSDMGLLGATYSGTCTLSVDGTGLAYEVLLPDTATGRDVAALAKRGDLKYSSFAFRTIEDDWDYTEAGFPVRTLRAVQLVDVAPVVLPAYLDSSVGMRSLSEHVGVPVEDLAGKSADELRAILAPPVSEDVGQRETHPAILAHRASVAAEWAMTPVL